MIDKKSLLKNFTIGFLPILVFIIADEFFGLTIGLMVAIAFGIIEILITYLREKTIHTFVLFDTGLILLLGLVSIILQNEIFFKIKPGLIGLILLLLLGISAFSKDPIILKLSGRYLEGVTLSTQQIKYMRMMMRRMFFLFTAHTILVFYAAFYLSKEAWAFISGGLFYILMGGLMGYEFLSSFWKRRKLDKQYASEEWFDIVSPEGKIIGRAPRSAVHGNPELLHPVVHVHIINSKGHIYLQKRAEDKEIQPGRWDMAIGGHIKSGETVDHALHREAEEELGITFETYQPLFRYILRNDIESELVHGFLLQGDGPYYPNPLEMSDARFWSIEEIDQQIDREVFTPNFLKEFEILKRTVFQQNPKR